MELFSIRIQRTFQLVSTLLDVFMLIKVIPVIHVVEAYILWNIVCKL